MSNPALARSNLTVPILGVVLIALAVLAIVIPNSPCTELHFFAFGILGVLLTVLWRPGEPAILILVAGMMWLQAAAPVLEANILGKNLVETGGAELDQATWLSLWGVLVVIVGIRLVLPKTVPGRLATAHFDGRQFNINRIVSLYLGGVFVYIFAKAAAMLVPGLSQPLLALAKVRWLAVFMIFALVIINRKRWMIFAAVLFLEVGVGFMGYFSGFKAVLILLLIVGLAFFECSVRWKMAFAVLVGAVIGVLVLFWSAVKVPYRIFLSQGQAAQVVEVPMSQRLEALFTLGRQIEMRDMEKAMETTLERMGYVKLFAEVLENVPRNVPHENGRLWAGAFEHLLKPRFLFPDKVALDDSARTSFYTGREVAGVETGTSIGIGFIGESYIDFGPIGMFVPILILGIFYGLLYRNFACKEKNILWGYGLATVQLLFSGNLVETSNIKIVGGNVMTFIVLWLFRRFCLDAVVSWFTLKPEETGHKPLGVN